MTGHRLLTEIAPGDHGLAFCGLRIVELEPGGSYAFGTGEDELIVLPLAGSGTVCCGAARFELGGREDVFSHVTDFLYVPRGEEVEIGSRAGGRFALPSSRARARAPGSPGPTYVAASDVAVELRGAGRESRQVNNFCSPEAFAADKLIAVEVLTPGGNWSSYPPHKHDEEVEGEEVALEEIYYFEVGEGPDGPGFGYQRVYGSGAGREIDVCREVRTGDVVFVPHGYHGPSMAPPGYPLYYLNVMAGPGDERAWRFRDDPQHAWIRATWADQDVDPRLPMTLARRPT